MQRLLLKTTIFVVLFFVSFFISHSVFAAVVINEVLYDATGTDTGKEYIILYNNGDEAINLTGYELNAVSGDYYVLPNFSLNAKSFVVIHWRAEGTNSQTDLYTGTSGFDANMGDTSGWVALFKSHPTTSTAKDLIVDYLEYGAGGKTWESAAVNAGIWTAGNFIVDADSGKAIKLKIDGQDNNSPDDWMTIEPTVSASPPTEENTPTKSQPSDKENASTSNQPPIADAGNDILAFLGQEINFNGTQSSDPENDELAFSWNMGDGRLIEKPAFTYKYLYPGTYLVSLTVYDGKNYATDTITVKIQPVQININEFLPNPSEQDQDEWIVPQNTRLSVL